MTIPRASAQCRDQLWNAAEARLRAPCARPDSGPRHARQRSAHADCDRSAHHGPRSPDYFDRKLEEALYEFGCAGVAGGRTRWSSGRFRHGAGRFRRIRSDRADAVMDTIGVDPDFRNQGVGRALLSQLLVNLSTLRVEGRAHRSRLVGSNCSPFSTVAVSVPRGTPSIASHELAHSSDSQPRFNFFRPPRRW